MLYKIKVIDGWWEEDGTTWNHVGNISYTIQYSYIFKFLHYPICVASYI